MSVPARKQKSPLEDLPDGTLLLWGSNGYSQIQFNNVRVHQSVTICKEFTAPVARVACGLYHTIVLLSNGQCFSLGRGDQGQLGHTSDSQYSVRVRRFSIGRASSLTFASSGRYHSVFLTDSGDVYECGSDETLKPPKQVALPNEVVKQIAAGGCRTLALMESGSVYNWGDNIRRGSPERNTFFTPEMQVSQLACSLNSCVALTELGDVYVWTNSEVYGDSPIIQVEALGGHSIYSVSTGPMGYTAVSFAGEVFTWKDRQKPKELGLSAKDAVSVRAVAPGDRHVLFYGYSAEHGPCVFGMGANSMGQLMVPGADHKLPVELSLLNGIDFSQVTAGGYHCAAITGAWSDKKSSLWEDLRLLRLSSIIHDLEFQVGDRTFVAHKCIVSARCKGDIVATILKEQPQARGILTFRVPDCSNPEHFATLLDYIYTERCTLSPQTLEPVGDLARRFGIQRLFSLCQRRAGRQATLEANSLGKDIGSLLKSQTLADITFVVQGHQINAHRAIIAARSEYYKALWTNSFSDSATAQLELDPDIRPAVFEAFLRFIYTDTLEVEGDDACDLLALASQYRLVAMQAQLERLIISAIAPDNVVAIAGVACHYEAEVLRRNTASYIARNWNCISNKDEAKDLPQEFQAEVKRIQEACDRLPVLAPQFEAPVPQPAPHNYHVDPGVNVLAQHLLVKTKELVSAGILTQQDLDRVTSVLKAIRAQHEVALAQATLQSLDEEFERQIQRRFGN